METDGNDMYYTHEEERLKEKEEINTVSVIERCRVMLNVNEAAAWVCQRQTYKQFNQRKYESDNGEQSCG